jgi:NADH-quinone oxidoreductase subunit J
MTPIQIVFLLVAAATLISAVMVVSARRIMHAALWLVLSLLGVAIIFVTLETSFFAVVQVIVYIGAIATLIIFAVMLTRREQQQDYARRLGHDCTRAWQTHRF